MQRLDLEIRGMRCTACSTRLQNVLTKANGVIDANVSFTLNRARVHYDASETGIESIAETIQRTGFDIAEEIRIFRVGGMTCSACSNRVQSIIENIPGVISASVNLALETAQISVVTGVVDETELSSRVADAGYNLERTSSGRDEDERIQLQWATERRTLLVAVLLTLPLVLQMVAQLLGYDDIHLMPAVEAALATPLQVVIGARFYRAAYSSLCNGSANMDVLVVLGTTSAYCYSWYLMANLGEAAEGQLYFEASAIIITLILFGKHFESRAKRGTSAAIRGLLQLRPHTANIRLDDNNIVERSYDSLAEGDVIVCKPGERIAVDGKVIEGEASVDEGLISGESRPIHKQVGDFVTGGSINIDGFIAIRAEAVGSNSRLEAIVRLVEQSQLSKIEFQRLVDRVSEVFVPIVIAISIATFGGWMFWGGDFESSLINAVSVLVIACPCALGLATPTAIVTGIGAAARAGILIKELSVLEETHRITRVAFDKTGTITRGTPAITKIELLSDMEYNEVVRIAASIQSASNHPIANAIKTLAEDRQLALEKMYRFRSFVAQGVEGHIDGERYLVGNQGMLERFGIEYCTDEGYVDPSIWLVRGTKPIAKIFLEDSIRPESFESVQLLSRMGIAVSLLSGDDESTTNRIGEVLNIDDSRGVLSPEDKVAIIKDFISAGEVVAMVGDGINDAPALSEANIGIAMATGADVAIDVAPVTLLRPDPRLVPAAIEVSKKTFRKIKQNLFWAFIYNVVMLPLAALGFLNPIFAGAAMAMSSVSVVANSLWLRSWHPKWLS